jgi:hypothetical protein
VVMNLSWKSGFSRNQDDSACDQNWLVLCHVAS